MTPEENVGALSYFMDLSEKLRKAKKENENVLKQKQELKQNQELGATLAGLNKDADHLKLHIYILTAALLIVAGAGWQMYLHLDDKIEHKMDYMNVRIDGVLNLQHVASGNNSSSSKKVEDIKADAHALQNTNTQVPPKTDSQAPQ